MGFQFYFLETGLFTTAQTVHFLPSLLRAEAYTPKPSLYSSLGNYMYSRLYVQATECLPKDESSKGCTGGWDPVWMQGKYLQQTDHNAITSSTGLSRPQSCQAQVSMAGRSE